MSDLLLMDNDHGKHVGSQDSQIVFCVYLIVFRL